jgi:site-specific recombinase XerD
MSQNELKLVTVSPSDIGLVANLYAAQSAFSDYQRRIAANTLRRQLDDLTLFSQYLNLAGMVIPAKSLQYDPQAWQSITHGIVSGFVRWQLQEGYAIGSINVRLSTVKKYCALASTAHVIAPDEFGLIKLVQGFRHKEGRNVDHIREKKRVGPKKAEPIVISFDQAQDLKQSQPDTPQGRRDTLLLCLLLDHGLRCGEIAELPATSLNLANGTMTFYRRKTDKTQTHELTRDTLVAAMRYFEMCNPESTLLMGSRKGGHMQGCMSDRAITDRMRVLCERIGITGVSAHDGRHAWATFAVRGGTDVKTLQDAGGWNSVAMPMRYAASQSVANKGVKLGR